MPVAPTTPVMLPTVHAPTRPEIVTLVPFSRSVPVLEAVKVTALGEPAFRAPVLASWRTPEMRRCQTGREFP